MYLAIDIGGTHIKYALINKQLDIIDHQVIQTAKHNLQVEITKQIDTIVKHYVAKSTYIAGIGISTAGVVNTDTGEIVYAGPTMPTYEGTNLKTLIEQSYRIPTVILNDVNAAAIGEKWQGAAKAFSHFICLTIGTGIGGAVFINNQLYVGPHFRAGEIGHIPMKNNQQLSYEQTASMTTLLNAAEAKLNFSGDGNALFEQAKRGDLATIELIDNWIKALVDGLSLLLCMLDPEAIVIGGAVSQQGDYLIDKIKHQLKEVVAPSIVMPSIYAAKLGNKAALYGAVHSFFANQTANELIK